MLYRLYSEFRVKKRKSIFVSGLLGVLALVLTSCLFESDDNGLNSWLSDHGMPSSYKVKTLSVDGLSPVASETFLDTSAHSANTYGVLGKQSNLVHDLVFDFAFHNKEFFADLYKSDSAASFIALYPLLEFYNNKNFPKDSLPLKEKLNLDVSWILHKGSSEKFVDSIGRVSDSVWYENLASWNADTTVDTTYSISLGKKDTVLKIDLPIALVERLKKVGPACRLQLRLSAPEASRIYRFYGASSSKHAPIWRVRTLSDSAYKDFYPFRMASLISNLEDEDALVLHGGVFDSLVVEYPSTEILKALSEFYGDEFPFVTGDSNDVRQAVILARMTFARDDSKGSSELGLPIQVVVGSYVDSADGQVRRMEEYRLDSATIKDRGHQNLIFHEGDSLTLQISYGVRDFINKASDGRTLKMMIRMGYPFLQEKDPTYLDYYNKTTKDTSFRYLPYMDYARYDFGTSMKSPATLKLWLATKRGDE